MSGEELSHARARRLRAGDRVTLFDGSGREAVARVLALRADGLDALVETTRTADGPDSEISLFVSGLRLPRLAWIVEKATELGVATVGIVETERTQGFRGRRPGDVDRLARIGREAAKQCGSARWPQIVGPVPVSDVFSGRSEEHRLLLDGAGLRFPETLRTAPAILVVGPEGGFTERERAAAASSGWRATSLPAGKLRAETAAVAGVVLLRAALEGGKEAAGSSAPTES